MKIVNGFFGEYRFLSNFHIIDIEFEGLVYPSTEHAYQAAKLLNKEERIAVKNATLPRDAKRMGKTLELRDDWEDIKYSVMYEVSHKKYEDKELQNKLIATKDFLLEETNTWNDTYWGVCNGVGENNLGKILMKIREELMT